MTDSLFSVIKHKTGRRARRVLIALLLFAALLVVNIFRLDFVLYGYYKDKTEQQITTTSALKAERGRIYDANMNLLAGSRTAWRIFVSTREIRRYKKESGKEYNRIISDGVAEIFDLDAEDVYKKITNTSVLDVTLFRNADENQYASVLELIRKEGLEDMLLTEAQTVRYYPEGSLAAHVLGFSGSDGVGLYGLEYQYNSLLTGTDGYYMYARDANGNALPGEYTAYVPATDGYSIVTTIDGFIQSALESELERIRVNHSVENRVSGIVMDVKTGAILGMATSLPFDPNEPFLLDAQSAEKLAKSGFPEGSAEYSALKTELMQKMWANKAVSEAYEPGSTFKIVTVAAALDSGAASINDRFSCPGYLQVGGWRIKCHKAGGHGSGFTLAYGLQMSCNPTMMTVASRIGPERFYDYVEGFGYFDKSGIDLPGEATTVFHDRDALGTTELATASFGQRFKVSMISHLSAIAAVANGGILVTPYVVERVVDSNGTTISEHQTQIKHRVISESVADTVAAVLEEGVSGEGGAKNAYVDGYKVAAKTGTSEKFDVLDENGRSYLRIGSTVAFAPSDEGGVAVIIVVDEPTCQVKYGSQVAAPYVSSLLSQILPYLEYESAKKPNTVTTDNYVGRNGTEVSRELKDRGIACEVIGDGETVLSQSPSAGVALTEGISTVYLYTERGGELVTSVPDFVGMTLAEANHAAIDAGINLIIRGGAKDGRESVFKVTAQTIPAATEVKRGSVMEIYVAAEETQGN